MPGQNPNLAKDLRLIDLLSHQTGLSRKDLLWIGAENAVLVDQKDAPTVCSDLEVIVAPRTRLMHNYWMYKLVADIITNVTVIKSDLDPDMVARPYIIGDYKTPYKTREQSGADGELMSASGGIRSNLEDLVLWAETLMADTNSEHTNDTSPSGVYHPVELFSGSAIMRRSAKIDELYALGLAKVVTPFALGQMGFNVVLLVEMPMLGAKSPPELIFYHNGAMPGTNHHLIMVPRLHLSIVVLTNSNPLGDIADWIGQLLIQSALDLEPAVDFLTYAEKTADKWAGRYKSMKDDLEHERTPDTPAAPAKDFAGTYLHGTAAVRLEIFQEAEELKIQRQRPGLAAAHVVSLPS